MKLGTEDKKKTALAIGLTAVAIGTVYVQFFSGDPLTPTPPRAQTPTAAAPASALEPQTRAARNVGGAPGTATGARRRTVSRGSAFEPIWRRSHEDETFDALSEDPTLQVTLLRAVREVGFDGVERNIFQFGRAKPVVPPPSQNVIAEAQRRQEAFAERTQAQPKAEAAPAPVAKRAPKINWKYYGFASPSGAAERRAFLLDGEDVLIGGEGDVFRNRYKIVRISLTNVVIEDMEFNEEQTLPITAPQG